MNKVSNNMMLIAPTFEGQTSADEDGNYTMFWSLNGRKWSTTENIFN